MERRILQVIEESPMRFLQQLRQIEEKETGMWADNMDKHNKNNEQLALYQARSMNQIDSVGGRMLQMQKQIEELSYKNVELERNLNNLTVVNVLTNRNTIEIYSIII